MSDKLVLDHKHLIVNASVANPPIDTEFIKEWLKKLVDLIGMKLVLGPFAHYCTAKDNEGLAAACCIETSHISIHVWNKEEVPYIRLDVYSCSCFSIDVVLQQLMEFEPYQYDWIVLDRNNKIEVAEIGEKQFVTPEQLLLLKYPALK